MHRRGDGVDALENLLRGGRVRDLESEILVERDDQLKGVNGVETEAARSEQRLIVTDFRDGDLQHQVLDHQLLDCLFQFVHVLHGKA